MKRPHLVHFLAIQSNNSLNIRAAVTMKENDIAQGIELDSITPRFPIQAFRLLNAYKFVLKVIGLDDQQNEVFKKEIESDSFGGFSFKIHLNESIDKTKALQVYEIGKRKGLDILLGTFIPLKMDSPNKVIICDFDKTLVETKYSNVKEVYRSLTEPLDSFPTLDNSVSILRGQIDKGFHPFILSASPHIYEDAMRDWLYKNRIFTAAIFLKDYRKVFSIFDQGLAPKDLKHQGSYKLGQLLDILTMSGVPNELTLMGDNFESDPLIYISLSSIVRHEMDPWEVWQRLKKHSAFSFTSKQDTEILNKIFHLQSLLDGKGKDINIKILIRKKGDDDKLRLPNTFEDSRNLIELYDGYANKSDGANKTI